MAAKLDAFSLKGVLTDIRESFVMLRTPPHIAEHQIVPYGSGGDGQ